MNESCDNKCRHGDIRTDALRELDRTSSLSRAAHDFLMNNDNSMSPPKFNLQSYESNSMSQTREKVLRLQKSYCGSQAKSYDRSLKIKRNV